jgi:hypothetical protein
MTSKPYIQKAPLAALLTLLIATQFPLVVQAQEKRSMMDTLQRILGKKDKSAGPEDTLIAPFADERVKPASRQNGERPTLPVNDVSLHVPHRSNDEVTSWVSQTVMDALELDKEKIRNINTVLSPYFTTEALQQFKDFGQKSNVFSSVFYGEGRHLVSYGKSTPLLMQAGPARIPSAKTNIYIDPQKLAASKASRTTNNDPSDISSLREDLLSLKEEQENGLRLYQWRYQVPATLSLVDNSLRGYNEKTTVKDTQTQRDITFCVTVSRSNLNPTDGMIISNWSTGNCNN